MKIAVQPASHKVPMDNKFLSIPCTTYASLAADGSDGNGSVAFVLDESESPFGSPIVICAVCALFEHGAVSVKKCELAPLSITAVALVCDGMKLILVVYVVLTCSSLLLYSTLVLPVCHNWEGCFHPLFSWLPPIGLARVACSLCPVFFAVHVLLLWS